MKHSTRTLPCMLSFAALAFSGVHVDEHTGGDRVYTDQHSVWVVTYVETKPGHFDDYIDNLNNIWRRYLEAQKKDGDVLSYKMIPVAFPRDGEPNLMLMVEFKDWSAFDRGNDYFDELAKRLQGGVDAATQSNIDREALRALRGGWVGREIKFKK